MQANRKNLYRHVEFLTSLYPYRNYKNPDSLRKAADYIKNNFETSGLKGSAQHWDVNGEIYSNILTSYQPEKKKRLIIGAHYDVYKDQPGADDNASSVAGLLELARLFALHRPALDYGIDFVSFCLEEPPFFKTKNMGSYIHAKSVYDENRDVIGMIALEMIGYYTEPEEKMPGNSTKTAVNTTTERNKLLVSGIKKYDEFNKKLSYLLQKPTSLASRRLSFADNYRNNGPSDHRNYWPYNIPAAMVIGTGGKGNPHYHKKTDTIDRLDFKVMTQAVNSLLYALINF